MSPASSALVVAMRHGPANALDPVLVARLRASLDEAEASGRPLVLTGNDRFFSAGLDLAGLPEDRGEMGAFVDAFDELVRRLFLFPCPTVAAVNGHAVAGGAILATACDVRIGATGAYRIGVSEVQLGVIFPAVAFEVLRAAIPPERTAEVLLRGRLTGPEDALANGFLHELAEPESLAVRAAERAEELGALPREAYAHTKRELRGGFADRALSQAAAKRERFLDTWFSGESKARRTAILGRGKKRG
ncbi:MAG: enoyl-CoA hydratase/isomerase family protein [Acidobacteriota bacterium]|nr:enoyl-CoA hydratase/isomerase family protein [Acidobacteriota bacterium]MXW70502.1 enoyl-CoA hydratase/isomerase family protein [Acidobacteriota bacterium]MYE44981.1 enoyl-CoA hydratase/isomerase family protein [Acidobacteriota bacterium]